jgi:hypothetical protein
MNAFELSGRIAICSGRGATGTTASGERVFASRSDDAAAGAIDGRDGVGGRSGDVGSAPVWREIEGEGSAAYRNAGDDGVRSSVDYPHHACVGADAPNFVAHRVSAHAARLGADGNRCHRHEFHEIDRSHGTVGGVCNVGVEAQAGPQICGKPLKQKQAKPRERENAKWNDDAIIKAALFQEQFS